MKEQTWNEQLWDLIEIWVDNQNNRKTSHLASNDYGKIEEFIQGLLDEKDEQLKASEFVHKGTILLQNKCIKDLEREVYLLKDEIEFLAKDFSMEKK